MDSRQTNYRLGADLPRVETALSDIEKQDLIRRIWAKDHTVWRPNPKEITNRLGWLTVIDAMREQVPALEAFASEARAEDLRHVVLLGMGGSSLGPEVMRKTFGPTRGYPDLMVLDSTVPAWIQWVADAIEPVRTLFLVSSKSGGTLETISLYRYFRGLVEQSVKSDRAGNNFVAITDAGTSLEKLARDQGFRRVFLNPSDIGGRYSVLSYFGLAPAALAGYDVKRLLERANSIRAGCVPGVPVKENSGAWLGAAMGTLALEGRDKLTLVTSPSIQSFGLWAEQILAESTGKDGKGIIPIAGEPLAAPEAYGEGRFFVYLRLEGDDNVATDEAIEALGASGQSWMRLDLQDPYDLGAEFYRWEFATSIAGALLSIHPFDQPNVQQAKDMTDAVMQEYQALGRLPPAEADGSLHGLLAEAGPDNYLAIMAYLRQTPTVDRDLAALRSKVMERYKIPVTFGYGPRFLHSTGQMHKGGPETGLFLQITSSYKPDLDIPGEQYGFGVLAQAQALGDLKALRVRGRPVARVQLGPDDEALQSWLAPLYKSLGAWA